MEDVFDFWDEFSFEKQVLDVSSWMLILVLAVAICVAYKLFRPDRSPKFVLVPLALISIGLPGIFRLLLDYQPSAADSRLMSFLNLYPDFLTNCLIVAASGELVVMLCCKLGRKLRAGLQFLVASAVPFAVWRVMHLRAFENFSPLVDTVFWLALAGAVSALALAIFMKRKRASDLVMISAAVVGVFFAANLLRFIPDSSFTVQQFETASIVSSSIGLITTLYLGLFVKERKPEFYASTA